MWVWVMEVNSFKKTVKELEEKITKYDTSIKHIQNEIEGLKWWDSLADFLAI